MNRVSKAIEDYRLVSIIRADTSITEELTRVLPAIYKAGLRLIEVTLNTPDALRAIEAGAKFDADDLLFGAGTVTTTEEAKAVVGAGAQFIICPVFSPAVIEEGLKASIPVIPGCFTPTEVFNAHQAGTEYVKLFPVTALGPSYVKDILAPMPQSRIIAVGGVGLSNIKEYFQAGAVGVGIGNSLLSGKLLKSGTEEEIYSQVSKFVAEAKR